MEQVIDQGRTDEFHTRLFQSWVIQMPEMFFYIDGHERICHRQKANLTKRFVSREKLCLNGTTEFWVNDQAGMPLMVVIGELNEKLKEGIVIIVEKLKKEIPAPNDKNRPYFTLAFDRESYEPKWFLYLWEKHRVAIFSFFPTLLAVGRSLMLRLRLCVAASAKQGLWQSFYSVALRRRSKASPNFKKEKSPAFRQE